jgi:hypothetical protein
LAHTRKKKSYVEKREIRNQTSKQKEHGNVNTIASCLITAINDDYITYRQFKEIQAIIDAKFDKPCWAITKKLS